MTTLRNAAVAGVLVLISSLAGAAPVTNGRFESGDLSGWTFFSSWGTGGNYGAAVDHSTGYPPLQGAYSALLVARGGLSYDPADCGRAEFFYRWASHCPYPISVPNTVDGGPTLANAPFVAGDYVSVMLAQDITARKDDVLSWEWQRYGEEFDGFFASITNGTRSSMLMMRGPEFASFFYETDGTNWTQMVLSDYFASGSARQDLLTIPEDGVWTLTFGIDQIGDGLVASGFTLDNVLLRHSVAEPSSLALLGLGGIGGLALARRRKR